MIQKYADPWMHWGEHVGTGVFGAAYQSVHLKRDCAPLLSFMKTDHYSALSELSEKEPIVLLCEDAL